MNKYTDYVCKSLKNTSNKDDTQISPINSDVSNDKPEWT